jgi:hypothetical protein
MKIAIKVEKEYIVGMVVDVGIDSIWCNADP